MDGIKKLRLNRVDSGGSTTRLQLAYNGKNGYVAIDKDFEHISQSQIDNNERQPYEVVLGKKEIFKVITIDLRGLLGAEHSQEKRYALKQQRLMDAIINHPHVKTDDESKYVSRERFYLADESKEFQIIVSKIKKRIAVANFVNSLDESGLRNVSSYLNYNVSGLTAEQVYVSLLRDRTEIVSRDGKKSIVEGWAYNEADKVLNIKQDEFAELTIIINKGVGLDIISKKDNGYWYGGHMIANSEEELKKYFRENKSMYENGLKPAVFEKDNLPISFNTEVDLTSAMKTLKKNKVEDVDIAAARARAAREERARELGVVGNVKGFLDETLEKKISDAEKSKAAFEEARK